MQKYSIDVNAYIKVLFVDTETWWLIHKRKTLCSMDRIQTCSWNLSIFNRGSNTGGWWASMAIGWAGYGQGQVTRHWLWTSTTTPTASHQWTSIMTMHNAHTWGAKGKNYAFYIVALRALFIAFHSCLETFHQEIFPKNYMLFVSCFQILNS